MRKKRSGRTRRTFLVAVMAGLAGCNTVFDSPSSPASAPVDSPNPTSTPTGPMNLTFTLRGCEGGEIRIAENSSAAPLYSGVDTVSATLERGESYHIRVEYEYEEYPIGTFQAVGTDGEKEIVVERCSYDE